MVELVHCEKEHSDCFPERSEFCHAVSAKMDGSRTDFIDLCSWKDIQKEIFWREVETLSFLSNQKCGKISGKLA